MDLTDIIFPKNCLGCKKEGKYVCSDCLEKVDTPPSICPSCLRPAIDGMSHRECLSSRSAFNLTSLWEYGGVVRGALLALKYKFAYQIAQEISEAIVKKLPLFPIGYLKNPVFIPIPAHPMRKNWRGFNQTEVVGKNIAKHFNWDYSDNYLQRLKISSPQTGLKEKERKRNIKGVFSINGKNLNVGNYDSIILFDDVWTTGSTLKEATRVLKAANGPDVWILTISRRI